MPTPSSRWRALPAGAALAALTAGTLLSGPAGPAVAADRPGAVTSLRASVAAGTGDLDALPRGEIRRSPVRSALRASAAAPAPAPRGSLTATRVSTFNIRFVDTPGNAWSPQAKAAFRAAADVWERSVESRVPIEVEATARSLGAGLLGGAGPFDFLRNEGRTPLPARGEPTAAQVRDDVFEPVALFNARTGRDALPPEDGERNPDIVADFNPNLAGLYLGTDARPPANQVDFRTVVLHEIGHGLGITGTATVEGTRASVGVSDINGRTGVRSGVSFDQLTYATSAAQAGSGGTRVLSLPDGSRALRTALTGGRLYWAGQQALTAAGGKVRLHAPSRCGEQGPPRLCAPGESPFVEGSSYSHLDEEVYPRSTPQGLMTPYLEEGEAYVDPGQVTLGMLADMGYAVPALTGQRFTAVDPVRVLDTRTGTGARAGVVRPGTALDVRVAGTGAVPAGATAVVLVLTGSAPVGATHVRAYPTPVTGLPAPDVSHLSLVRGTPRSSTVTVPVGDRGSVRLLNGAGSAYLQADLAGWYGPGAASAFTAVSPVRLLDTRRRLGTSAAGPLGPRGLVDVRVAGTAGVPAGATAAAVTVTVLAGSGSTELRAYPGGGAPLAVPGVTSLSASSGATVAGQLVVRLGPDGTLRLRNARASRHVVVDLDGWYGPDGALFRAVSPRRVLDTRVRLGTSAATPRRLGRGQAATLTVGGATTIPRTASSVVATVTGVAPSARTDVRVVPGLVRGLPPTAQLSLSPGVTASNAVVTRLEGTRASLRNSAGTVGLVVDAAGWFGPAS